MVGKRNKNTDESATERERKKTGRYKRQEKYTGEQVGLAFLLEFIKVYKGSQENIIPDEKRLKMVKSLDNYEDMSVYSRYREIYWHFLVKTNEHESLCMEARYWYLKLKAAIADETKLTYDETDNQPDLKGKLWYFSLPSGKVPTTNFEKIQGLFDIYKHSLQMCRGIEVGMELVSQALGIDDSPFKGLELFGTYLEDTNKLIQKHEKLKLTPISMEQLNPPQIEIETAKLAASLARYEPDKIFDIFHSIFKI